jgi:hypothetical protein
MKRALWLVSAAFAESTPRHIKRRKALSISIQFPFSRTKSELLIFKLIWSYFYISGFLWGQGNTSEILQWLLILDSELAS